KRKYEMAQLRRPPNRLSAEEYDLYQLERLSWEEKTQFLGGRSTPAISSNNDLTAQALTRDKLITYGILQLHRFPFPEIKAVGHTTRSFPGAASLTSVKAVSDYLETQADFPM